MENSISAGMLLPTVDWFHQVLDHPGENVCVKHFSNVIIIHNYDVLWIDIDTDIVTQKSA